MAAHWEGYIVAECEAMCPEAEAAERRAADRLQRFERTGPVVKKFARTTTMTGATTRTPRALLATVQHLIEQTFHYRRLGVPFHDVWAFADDRLRAVIQDVAAQPADTALVEVLEMVIRTRIIVIGLQGSVLADSAGKGPDPVLNVQQLNKAIALALSLYAALRSGEDRDPDRDRDPDQDQDQDPDPDRRRRSSWMPTTLANEEETWRYFLLLGLGSTEPRQDAERFNDFLCKCPRALLRRPSLQQAIALARGYAQGNYVSFAQRIHAASVLEKSLVLRPSVIERHRRAAMDIMAAAYHATSRIPVPLFARALCLAPGEELEAWVGGRVREAPAPGGRQRVDKEEPPPPPPPPPISLRSDICPRGIQYVEDAADIANGSLCSEYSKLDSGSLVGLACQGATPSPRAEGLHS